MVDSIYINQCTVIQNGNGANGRFIFEVTHDTSGCPNPTGFNIMLKDDIKWTMISYMVEVEGTASCWNFNNNNSYIPEPNRLIAWNSSIDRIISAENSFELPQFATKMSACDNNSDNFMHSSFRVGDFRKFHALRRRNLSLSGLAGPAHGRSCHSAGGRTIISNIRIH